MTPGSTAAACLAVLRRDLLLAWRRRGDAALPLLYAIIVTALFPFAIGPEAALLSRIAAGVVLVTVLLAMLISLDSLFRADLEDGSLEQLLLAPQSLTLLAAMKILAHWLTTALPLLLLSPLLAAMLGLPQGAYGVLFLALAVSTPLISLFGAVLTSLTVDTRRSGMLLALMLLPLMVPVVIFAAGAVAAAAQGLPWAAPLAFLGAMLALAVVLAPLACGAALRIALDA
ncbi:MAG TPA: heme exporter protein CcmB [Rhodanobacteraceae bacterium]|nr:heme exporter protein CcmB [Rhodanobacteraceae bacterium]